VLSMTMPIENINTSEIVEIMDGRKKVMEQG
jgi:hypothetical protein